MAEPLPTFDLILATVDRAEELGQLLDSLERQTYSSFRLIVVEQNEDDRVAQALAGRRFDVLHLRSERGLSRARNIGLAEVAADIVCFPDDDCTYPDDLLERIARRFADTGLGGLTGREVDGDGHSSPSWERNAAVLSDNNLWNRAISFTIFLRRDVVAAVGSFDEELGLGSGKLWESGEEIDFLVRAVREGARIAYDPSLTVIHDEKRMEDGDERALAYRDGASVGYILRKHRYNLRALIRMLVRPLGGVVLAFARRDVGQARVHLATLRGRLTGYRGAS